MPLVPMNYEPKHNWSLVVFYNGTRLDSESKTLYSLYRYEAKEKAEQLKQELTVQYNQNITVELVML